MNLPAPFLPLSCTQHICIQHLSQPGEADGPGTVRVAPMDALRYVLFPGRHHLVTSFQRAYLAQLLAGDVRDTTGAAVTMSTDARIVFAVTSADHGNTRRNPVPGHRREAQLERFAART